MPPKFKQVSICHLPLDSLQPSPENAKLYKPVDRDDPEVKALADSIRELGVQEPLVVTRDGYILSGHRRYVAAKLAGLKTVPCRVKRFRRDTDLDRFVKLLREYNRQRIKSRDELLREAALDVDPEQAYANLSEYRIEESKKRLRGKRIKIRGEKKRAEISNAKAPMLAAVKKIVFDHEEFWPLSVRQVHYMLLNDSPLKHASKPDSLYQNDRQSYSALCDLLARARLVEVIPWESISDETRPVEVWQVHRSVQTYLFNELDRFLRTYWRDLQQSQPHHIEIVGEKNTLAGTIRPVAAEFCIPFTLGRGYCSLDPRHEMAERYSKSGKNKLIILMLTDFDPEGEDIAHSFARSMRDDFNINRIEPIKVVLTAGQIKEHKLATKMKVKGGSRCERFVKEHGENVWELEALSPKTLQHILRKAILSVLNTDFYNYEVFQEHDDAKFLEVRRKAVLDLLRNDGQED